MITRYPILYLRACWTAALQQVIPPYIPAGHALLAHEIRLNWINQNCQRYSPSPLQKGVLSCNGVRPKSIVWKAAMTQPPHPIVPRPGKKEKGFPANDVGPRLKPRMH